MTKKPCIQCGKNCEVLPVQLGDIFTLTYLRICSGECMFLEAYDYLRKECLHKSFCNSLYDKQYEDDKADRIAFVEEITAMALGNTRDHFPTNPNLLTTPAPEFLSGRYQNVPIPGSERTMNFTRPSKEERIRWQNEHVYRLKNSLKEAMTDLEKLENE